MAADQRKRRLNTSVISSSRELGRAKKKKVRLLQCDLEEKRTNISLKWDDKKNSVVAKRGQIGLARKDFIPFIGHVTLGHNILTDVFSVPREIFDLENLKEVLTLEAWETHLSGNERNSLMQFLPKGAEMHRVVQELLAGDNFHFGNPFLKWGASLCSGNLHPDAVIHHGKCLKTSNKLYYSELQKYHNGMIGNLLLWKERWGSCKDPEEISDKIWRNRKQAERNISFDANQSRYHDAEEDLAATSESSSWAADEKTVSSDNQSLMEKHGEQQQRKGFMEDVHDDLSAGNMVSERLRKGEKLCKQNIQCGDGSKYMSYIKVSREQHQRVKSTMKDSSSTILSRSLNRVLGNLDAFHIQPFEEFEEEERKKLHQHWLQLATIDLPLTFANWRTWKMKKQKLAQSLEQEMEENLKLFKEDEEKENANISMPDPRDNRAADSEAAIMDEEEEMSDEEMADGEAEKHEPVIKDDYETLHISTHDHNPQSIPSVNHSHEFVSMNLDPANHVIMEKDDNPVNLSLHPVTLNRINNVISQEVPLFSSSDVWPAVIMPDSCYHPPMNQDYTSTHELSLGHSRVFEEQQAGLIDLESQNHEEDTVKDLFLRQPNEMSFFNPYTDQEVQNRNELQRLFKGQEGLPYRQEQKQTSLDFQPTSSISMVAGQFSGHFGQQFRPSRPLERLNDAYMHQNVQEKLFSDGVMYTIPRQEPLPPVIAQDWVVNTPHGISVPLPSHMGGGELSRNWFSGENRARGGWSSLDALGPTNSIVNRSNADQSLFVLSQCNNELHPGAPYRSTGSNERFIQSGTYSGLGALFPTASNVLPNGVNPLKYYTGHESTAAPVTNNNIEWMNVPRQNSALQDIMGKAFSRSWNK